MDAQVQLLDRQLLDRQRLAQAFAEISRMPLQTQRRLAVHFEPDVMWMAQVRIVKGNLKNVETKPQ